MSGNVKIYGGGNSFEPGIVTTFPANTVPYINGSQTTAYDANFTYQSGQLGIGIASSLGEGTGFSHHIGNLSIVTPRSQL